MSDSVAAFFGQRLREIREAKDLTQTQLADKAGIKANSIARLERSEREPAWRTILALAEALGVDCTVFTQPPAASGSAPGPGRPKKADKPAAKKKPKPKKKGG